MSVHLRPTAPIAADALLPGDPGRALMLAQALLVKPAMSNHNRGLWGYHGTTAEGLPLTIQSTGMGGPSAAIVLQELAELGVKRAVRVGTCGALGAGLELGELLIADRAIVADGTSTALGAGVAGATEPDAELTEALTAAAGGGPGAAGGGPGAAGDGAARGPVISTDLFYDDGSARAEWAAAGALAVEMEAAALFALGRRLGVAVGCLLVVSDLLEARGGRQRIEDEALVVATEGMGRVAVAALGG